MDQEYKMDCNLPTGYFWNIKVLYIRKMVQRLWTIKLKLIWLIIQLIIDNLSNQSFFAQHRSYGHPRQKNKGKKRNVWFHTELETGFGSGKQEKTNNILEVK